MASAPQTLTFQDFLERMKDPRAADLVRDIRNFVKSFESRPPDPDRDAAAAQAFFEAAEASWPAHPLWAGSPPPVLEGAGEGLEKYVMTKVHGATFGVSPLDRERDEALALRLRALSFVEPAHLDIPPGAVDERAVRLAGRELLKVNDFKAPRDKLVCILNCCRVLNNALAGAAAVAARRSGGGGSADGESAHAWPPTTATRAPGADDFLPALVYTLIKAAPPQVASNLEYVQRFRGARRLAGEAAYFFTQLYGAASFVETVNTGSLSVDPDVFVARMVAAGVPDMQLLPPPSGGGGGDVDGGSAGHHRPVAAAAAAAAAAGVSPRVAAAAAAGHGTSASAGRAPPPPTAADLEAEGVALVVAADGAGALAASHPWLYTDPTALALGDVPALLAAYKEAVLRAEAVCRAADARAAAWGSGVATPPPAPLPPIVTSAAPPAEGGEDASAAGLDGVGPAEAAGAVESPGGGGGATAAAPPPPPPPADDVLAGLVLGEGAAAPAVATTAPAAPSTDGQQPSLL